MRRTLVGLAILGIALTLPLSANADDSQIAEHIHKKLKVQKAQGRLKGFSLDVLVEEGSVLLRGHVGSKQQPSCAVACNAVPQVAATTRRQDLKLGWQIMM